MTDDVSAAALADERAAAPPAPPDRDGTEGPSPVGQSRLYGTGNWGAGSQKERA